jgi:hypothetical protein
MKVWLQVGMLSVAGKGGRRGRAVCCSGDGDVEEGSLAGRIDVVCG